MKDLEWNYKRWQETEDWSSRGDRWSKDTGGTEAQWYWFVYPRVQRYLPAGRILEIAPGYGRWTQFLVDKADEVIGVDLAPRCVAACNERFAGTSFKCYVNDGLTMPMVEDASVDFVFSFGSFAHMEEDVAGSYITEIARVLKPDGNAFIHHSNGGGAYDGIPPRNFSRLSAKFVAEKAVAVGLLPITQELHSWGTPVNELISCMTVIAAPKSQFAGPLEVLVNDREDAESAYIARISRLYVKNPQ
jgi:SAM-dependent methyltransferase